VPSAKYAPAAGNIRADCVAKKIFLQIIVAKPPVLETFAKNLRIIQ